MNEKKRRNLKTMALLWIFAILLCALVLLLMNLRGPAVAP